MEEDCFGGRRSAPSAGKLMHRAADRIEPLSVLGRSIVESAAMRPSACGHMSVSAFLLRLVFI